MWRRLHNEELNDLYSSPNIDFNNMETRAVMKYFFLQGKAPKEIHAILTEILDFFLPGRAKDLSAPL